MAYKTPFLLKRERGVFISDEHVSLEQEHSKNRYKKNKLKKFACGMGLK